MLQALVAAKEKVMNAQVKDAQKLQSFDLEIVVDARLPCLPTPLLANILRRSS
jgi:hypothetical protein